ncbi:MAG: trigger factor [Holdemanella sp.]|nr:trigger factor [Holdemanella sp.]
MTTIKQYKGLEVTVEKKTVTAEDIKREIDAAVAQNPKKISIDGPVKEGDMTIIDFEGFKDGVAFPGGKGENYNLGIGSHTFIPGFEEAMVGMEKGETRNINVTFPENYGEPTLAGQPVVFKVTVHDIVKEEPNELNEEFVKSLNIENVSTVEELEAFVESALNRQAEGLAIQQSHDAILEKLVENTETEVSEEALEFALQQQLARISQDLQAQGMSLTSYLQLTGQNPDAFKEQLTAFAKKQVILENALKEIVAIEKIEATDEEIDEQYTMISMQYQVPVESLKEQIPAEQMKLDMAMMKANQLVLDNAKVDFK